MNEVNKCIGNLQSATSSDSLPEGTTLESPKAFIAHGPRGRALEKTERFLRALGVEPLVVEEQPTKARALDDKVDGYLKGAHCVIILATGDDEIKGKVQPRQNVIHETGLAQKTHPERIIYLLEEGAEFPSNIAPKVHQRFRQENMEEAFMTIARELREFGQIKAARVE